MTMLEQSDVSVWQDMFTSIIEDADSNILLIDEEFKVIGLNSGFYWIFYETYGIELKKGSSLLNAMEPKNPRLTHEWKERCMIALSGTPIKVEDVFEIDGRNYYWEIHFKSSALPDGSQVISVFSRDITVRKAYQRKIIENEANLRSILNTIEDSIWLINADYELIDFNKEFYKKYKLAFGVKLVKGTSILSLLPDDAPELKETWRQRYESGLKGRPGKYYDSIPVENELRKYEIKTYPIVENGEVTGLTVFARDITNQTRAEDLLKKQNEELIKINSELDRFVYSASHDLRAPLMSVKGLLNMIKRDPDKENTEQYLELIERSVNKLDHFISDIIHYSRNSRMEIMPKRIDFHELLEESIESLKFMEGAEQVRSIKNIQVMAPFYSDYSRLLMIFNNIIANAVRYRNTRTGADSFLKIDIFANEETALIRFTDNGVGISDEYVDKIFKMFFRANADSKGSGLGLYIVKGAIEKLEGTIQVQSKLGEGTSFTIEVPNVKMTASTSVAPEQ
ncbi:sensor histidine kinase [Chryseolinea lacunae]|uniref:histidine kinase n=1 Tax=Chryseolinea lacunae TaxID=2801331 RepID=A0ABS1KWX0_9BACT|nr:PAS domain-containing sensor histidine kinase [Chryseolinea lacunae]MBL0743973.1 PAS domain-containing sensor histidine kinase [Chryseolinea lacunae]